MAEEKGSSDARGEQLISWRETFGILDDVFAAFIETNVNMGHHRTIDEILASHNRRRFYVYEHLQIPYLATTFTYEGTQAEWINIKLNCNGFTWPEPPSDSREFRYARHGARDWVTLPRGDFYAAVFPRMYEVFGSADDVCFYYAESARRADLKFFYDQDRIHVIVTFEMGHPYFDDHVESLRRR